MVEDTQRELEYYAAMFKHMQHKKYELFVVTKIIHRLNDPTIEFTTQQLVRDEGKYFLLDLYFPQFRLAVEVDEGYHKKRNPEDKIRERAVEDRAHIHLARIKVYDRPAYDVDEDIEKVICILRKRKLQAVKKESFIPFVYGRRYRLDRWIAKGKLSIFDSAKFRSHGDVAKMFQKDRINPYRAVVEFARGRTLWFPKWHENRDWINTLSPDGKMITMEKKAGGRYSIKAPKHGNGNNNGEVYVFGHHLDVLGQAYYTFDGVFKDNGQKDGRTTFSRVCTSIELPSGDHLE